MTRRSFAFGAALAAFAVLAPGDLSLAKSRETYVFLISRVDLAEGVPKEVEAQVVARLGAAITGHQDLAPALPRSAPDPEAQPAKFKKYLKTRRQRAFKVNIAVSEYSMEVGPGEASRPRSQYLTVRTTLQLFGETVPDRVMAFSGEGSATVKLEVGKNVRPRDREEASSAALDQAVAGAIGRSLVKLQEPPPSQKKPAGKKPGKG